MSLEPISHKTNRVLRIILAFLFLIVFRIWHLSVIQREEKLIEAQRPQRRTHLVRANRGAICDRFHVPLALNRIGYNASIYYSHIAEVPVVAWKSGPAGERLKTFPRKEYIQKLAQLLSTELALDALRVEDEIHSKASLFPHVPYIIKTDLSEKEHYRLSQLERLWPGLYAEVAPERFYPLGKTAADLIGTVGSINAREYRKIAEEVSLLQEAVNAFEEGRWEALPAGYETIDGVYRHLHELREKAYTLNDRIGKTGVEAQFEQELRGYFGKKCVEVDQKGRFVHEFPGSRSAVAGRQVVLSISAELQQFAEGLLAQDDAARDGRSIGFDPVLKARKALKQPWIKGGSIVAMDPNTGEVLAMASYPRFDPNDFIPSGPTKALKSRQVNRWLENERFVAALWDGRERLSREHFTLGFYEEETPLTWDLYLQWILPAEGPLKAFFQRYDDIKSAIQLQEDFEALLYFTHASDPRSLLDALFPSPKPTLLDQIRSHNGVACLNRFHNAFHSISSHHDKLFALDLLRIAVYSAAFTDELIPLVGSLKISAYHSFSQVVQQCDAYLQKTAQESFRKGPFQQWRAVHQKEFLAEKRAKEKEAKTYARPFIDYLDEKEKELFGSYWAENRLHMLADLLKSDLLPDEIGKSESSIKLRELLRTLSPELQIEWLRTFRSFQQLDRPLLGTYRKVRKTHLEKDLAAAFYPIGGFGFSRSFSFQAAAPPGSVFKLATAYAALQQNGPLFSMIDEQQDQIVGYSLGKTPYPRHYKGGRLPRSSIPHIGKIDLIGALEQSSNPYFSILAGDFLTDPEDLAKAARLFGLGEKTGIELPNEASGNLPNDLKTNRTGLYSFAIGQHTALTTPIQIAGLLSTLANGGRLIQPKIVKEMIGPLPDRSSLEPFEADHYLAQTELNALGIHFPLFTAAQTRKSANKKTERPTKIKRQIPLSSFIRNQIFEGMDRVIWGAKGRARASGIKSLLARPLWMRDYLALQHQMIGKTGTAEFLFNPNINPSSESNLYKHIWCASISFTPDKTRWSRPELVVVVFLRYGDGGKEAAPLAAEMIHKWREICSRN